MRHIGHTDDEDGAPEGQSDPGVEDGVAVHHPLNQKRQVCELSVRSRVKIQPGVALRLGDQSTNEPRGSFSSAEPEELEKPAAIQREEEEIS